MPAQNDTSIPSNQGGAPTAGPASGTQPAWTNTAPNGQNTVLGNNQQYVGNATSAAGAMTDAEQAQAFINPNAQADQFEINGINTNQAANQAGASQLGSSPLTGITTLGQSAQAGLAQAGNTNINTGTSGAITQAQIQNINQLNAQAQGNGPSPATIQAQQLAQQNIAAQMGLIGSQRGSSNSALGLRSAGEAVAQANQQAVQAGVLGKAQEELNAQQQLGTQLGTTQGQVMQGAQAQAGLTQQTAAQNTAASNTQAAANAALQQQALLQQGSMTQQTALANTANQQQTALANQQNAQAINLANLQAAQQTQGINTNQTDAQIQAQSALDNTNMTAAQNYANLVQSSNLSQEDINQKLAINASNNQLGLIGAGIAGGAGVGGAIASAVSDKHLKTNISPATRSMKDFLSKIDSKRVTSFNLLDSAL